MVFKIWKSNYEAMTDNYNISLSFTYGRSVVSVFVINYCKSAVCETKFCGIIDQFLFYTDLAVHYMQNLENLT
jgi:hypothetical protein